MSASVIPALRQILLQIRQLGEHLLPYAAELDPENVTCVREHAVHSLHFLDEVNADPTRSMESREVRHDFRNKIGAVRGSSELMLMEVPSSHVVTPALRQIVVLSNQVLAHLDSIREGAAG